MTAALAVAALVFASANANATPLPPGSITAAPTPDVVVKSPFLGDTGVQAVAGTNGFSGVYREVVIDEGAANPLGGLTFIYQVENTSSTSDVGSLSSNNWAAIVGTVDAGFAATFSDLSTLLGGTGPVPLLYDWSSPPTLSFTWAPKLSLNPEFSSLVVIRTKDPFFIPAKISLIDGGGGSQNNPGFAPSPFSNVVPEPSTMALAGLGALGFLGYGLRRRKALGA